MRAHSNARGTLPQPSATTRPPEISLQQPVWSGPPLHQAKLRRRSRREFPETAICGDVSHPPTAVASRTRSVVELESTDPTQHRQSAQQNDHRDPEMNIAQHHSGDTLPSSWRANI